MPARRISVVVGVKVIVKMQVALTASVAGNAAHGPVVLVSAKSVLARTILVIVSGALPVFCNVTDCGPLGVFTNWSGNDTEGGLRDTPGAVPVPLRAKVCGLSPASSVKVMPPRRMSVVVGVNVTVNVQDPPVAKVAGNDAHGAALVSAKSVPTSVILVMVSEEVPLLVRVAVRGALLVPTIWLANARPGGSKVTAGAIPIPLMLKVCGLSAASSAMVTPPRRMSVVVGLKVTVNVQVPLGASVAGNVAQGPVVLVSAKSGLGRTMLVMVRAEVPELVRITDVGALVVPTS